MFVPVLVIVRSKTINLYTPYMHMFLFPHSMGLKPGFSPHWALFCL